MNHLFFHRMKRIHSLIDGKLIPLCFNFNKDRTLSLFLPPLPLSFLPCLLLSSPSLSESGKTY